jgi:integrase
MAAVVPSDDELRSVWLACEEVGWPFGPLVKLLILTGQRLNEVSRLPWAEIDLDAKLWTIPRQRTKNDVAHTAPLSTQAVLIISELPVIPSEAGLVFTTTGTPQSEVLAAQKNALITLNSREKSPDAVRLGLDSRR